MFKKFLKSQKGATAIEYALIAALISIAIIGGVTYVNQGMTGMYNTIGNAMETVD